MICCTQHHENSGRIVVLFIIIYHRLHREYATPECHTAFFFRYFYCISSDFSDLPDMTDEYIDLSVYALTGWLLYILIIS